MELPGVAADQLLIDENNIRDEHWEPPVRNLDRFFTSMYQYYVAKGLPAVILQQICGVVTLGFTISASIFLIAFVDWNNLTNCKDEQSRYRRLRTSLRGFLGLESCFCYPCHLECCDYGEIL